MKQGESKMKRSVRLTIAVLLTGLLVVTAIGVWAAPKFQGTVPSIPVTGQGTCSGGPIDMGTALFTPISADCTLTVDLVEDPAGSYVPAPEGEAFTGSTFKVTADPMDTVVQVCYAFPPEFENKEAKIHKLNEDATPVVWVEVSGADIGDGTICVTSVVGIFSLLGNP
jgi:hypothetical protein